MTIPVTDDRLFEPHPRCFIIQEPQVRDQVTFQLKPMMNFSAAQAWGEPVVCLPPGPMALAPYPAKEMLKEALKDFSDRDYIICVGDPSLIFMAGMIACDLNRGRAKLLKRDRDSKSYILVEVNIHQRLGQLD
jgi:hypothetical protein